MELSSGLKKSFVALAAVAALAGCAKDPVSSAQTNNREVPVATLFNYKGCEVNRFYDGSRAIYFVLCPDGAGMQAQWQENCGKNCTRPQVVETVRSPALTR